MLDLDQTKILVRVALAGKKDLSGVPMFLHAQRVMENLGPDASLEESMVALLHDLIEDTAVTDEDLLALGYPPRVVQAVLILTHREGETYSEYIDRICESGNLMVLRVKLADNQDNTDLDRMTGLKEDQRRRMIERYAGVRARLWDAYSDLLASAREKET